MSHLHPLVETLKTLIIHYHWQENFQQALYLVQQKNIPQLQAVKTIDDYLNWINDLLYWIPSENESGRVIYDKFTGFYFILDQAPIRQLQTPIIPAIPSLPLTPLSAWIVNYAQAMGEFLDTPESLTADSLASFYQSPKFNMNDYSYPRGGWKTFNQFFARHVKPGLRPIAALCDQQIIVSPADATFAGQWRFNHDSKITLKGLQWSVQQLLAGSPYQHRFNNGLLMHAFLDTSDYHRQHTPVAGKVLEARVILGQAYLEVQAVPILGDTQGQHSLQTREVLSALDHPGYAFCQTRGLIVLDTPIGLVAILPIGMAQVASVVITAEEGVSLRKGEEISYFQFGGSDIVVIFEAASNVNFTAQVGVHYQQGTKIAQAFPVL
jgi:phosphatidylserine decarboxylase